MTQIREDAFFGENIDTESDVIALTDNSSWDEWTASPSGISMDSTGDDNRIVYSSVPFTKNTSTERHALPGAMMDWEISATMNLSISGSDIHGSSAVMAEVFLLPKNSPNSEFFIDGLEVNPIFGQEKYAAINMAIRLGLRLDVSYIGAVNADYSIDKRSGWEWGPRCVFGESAWQGYDTAGSDNDSGSLSCTMTLKHVLTTPTVRSKTVQMRGTNGLHAYTKALKFQDSPAQYTIGGTTYYPAYDLDIFRRPVLRFGENVPPDTLNVLDYRALESGEYILVNEFLRPPDYEFYYEYDPQNFKFEPYFADVHYSLGLENREFQFTANNPSVSKTYEYAPKVKRTILTYDGTPMEGFYMYFPYNLMDRVLLRISRNGGDRTCTGSITNVSVKSKPPSVGLIT